MRKYQETVIDLINKNQVKVFAEIGVYRGSLCHQVWEHCSLDRYYLIDPWLEEHHNIGPFVNSRIRTERVSQEELNKYYWKVVLDAPSYAKVIRMSSVEAASLILNGSLDMVFIDASHLYADVVSDVLAWKEKIKEGGVFAGDDYCKSFPGVVQAVDELVEGFTVQNSVWWS